MHRSALVSLVIDCKTDDLDAAAEFWSKALGKPVLPATPEEPNYRELKTAPGEIQILVQKVDHESRVHLDIETDDKDAEAARLEALGAKKVGFVRRWWVLQAPTGQKFCVVNPQRGPMQDRGNEWP